MLINYCRKYDRLQKISRGEKIVDYEFREKQIKNIQPLIKQRYEAGVITKEQYERYTKVVW